METWQIILITIYFTVNICFVLFVWFMEGISVKHFIFCTFLTIPMIIVEGVKELFK